MASLTGIPIESFKYLFIGRVSTILMQDFYLVYTKYWGYVLIMAPPLLLQISSSITITLA